MSSRKAYFAELIQQIEDSKEKKGIHPTIATKEEILMIFEADISALKEGGFLKESDTINSKYYTVKN